MSRFTCPELDHSLALVLFPAAMVSEAIRHACPGSGLRPHGKCNASFRPSLFAKSEAARNGETLVYLCACGQILSGRYVRRWIIRIVCGFLVVNF